MGLIRANIITIPGELVETVTIEDTGGGTYEEILYSIGTHSVYEIEEIYLQTKHAAQIYEGFEVQRKDVNGTITRFSQKPVIDIYQSQNSLVINLVEDKTKLDNKTTFEMKLLPNEVVRFYLKCKEITPNDFLGEISFFNDSFFKDFKNAIN